MSIPLILYLGLVLAVTGQRLFELRIASRNTDLLITMGAEEVASGHYTAMRLLHGSWLACCVIEAVARDGAPSLSLVLLSLTGLVAGQFLRIAAMRTLGPRWTTRILVMPDMPPVTGGIYRWVRHPNYVGVVLEIAALPLIFGSFATALVFTIANLVLLVCVRIPAEEAALVRANDYTAYRNGRGGLNSTRSNA